MIRRVRDAVTLCIFLALVAVSLAASVEAARQGLPDPEVIDPVKRLQWLADHEVREQPRDVKLRLAHRLEEDFANDIDWQAEINQFDDAEWERFEANFEELMPIWLMQKVDTWSNLPIDQKNYYIDEQFKYMERWKFPQRGAAILSDGGRRRRGQPSRLDEVFNRALRYAAEMTPPERRRFEAFAQAVAARRILQQMMPGQFGRNME